MIAPVRDLRDAARSLSRSPGFFAVAVLTLALGIGATTTIFSVVHSVLIRPLPYPEPAEVTQLWQVGGENQRMPWSAPNFLDVRERTRSFAALAAYRHASVTVSGGLQTVRADGVSVSDDFFRVLGVEPALGRSFSTDEFRQAASVAIIGHGLWQREFAGAADAIGGTLRIDDEAYTIVGIMPAGKGYPAAAEFWRPRAPSREASRSGHSWLAIGRLADGVTAEQARRELGAIAADLKDRYGKDTYMVDAAVLPLHETIVANVRPTLLILFGAAACLLLIAAANVANLLLARMTSRRRELALRQALGAGRLRLTWQLLAEPLLLAIAGGALGVLLAATGNTALHALIPDRLPRGIEANVDGTVLAFTLAISLLSALGIGLATAVRATAAQRTSSLQANQRADTGSVAGQRIRGALAISQIALSAVLLVGAGLLAHSFVKLLDVDTGYRTREAVVMEATFPYADDEAGKLRLAGSYRALLDRLRAIPGVTNAGGVDNLPLTGGHRDGTFLVLSRPDEVRTMDDWSRLAGNPSRTGHAQFRIASREYFEAMDIPLVRGRLFDERDDLATKHAAVISETLARTRWPDEDPIGKLIQFGNMDGDPTAFTIVGIVGDIREQSVSAEPRPMFYGCTCQRAGALGGPFTVVLRGTIDSTVLIAAAREAVRELNPDVPVSFRTIEQVFSASIADRRFSMTLSVAFGVSALLLAVLGIYGVIAYLVAQQTKEIGVRMALGARTSAVMRHVLSRGALLTVIGLTIGMAAAYAASEMLASLLYEVSTNDPAVFSGVALLLGSLSLLGCWLPARRAARLDPMIALREE